LTKQYVIAYNTSIGKQSFLIVPVFGESQMTVTIKPLSFNVAAKTIVSAYAAMDKAVGKTRDAIQVSMQQFCDKWLIENGKTIESCKALGKTIRESEVVVKVTASGAIDKKTFTEYAQSAMRAVFHGVAWEAGLKNDPAYALPGGKVSTPTVEKAGKVSVTTIDAAHKTLQKALSQYRLLNQSMLVAALLDSIQEFYPEFKESNDTATV